MIGRDGSRPAKVREAIMFKRIDHVEIVTEQFDRTGYGSTDRSIFPESQFGTATRAIL